MLAKHPRFLLLVLYVAVNIAAAIIIFNTGELLGDAAGRQLYKEEALLWATVLTVSSYLIILGPLFNAISKIKVKQPDWGQKDVELGARIGKLLFLLQAGFMAFNLLTGLNIAGSGNIRTESSLSFFWVLMPVDALFLIYYGTYRESRHFYPNILIYIVSNLLRGWTGFFMFILFIEWCRAARAKKLSMPLVISIGLVVVLLYPMLSNLKWIIRASTTIELTMDGLMEGFVALFDSADYIQLVWSGLLHLISRLQSVSLVVETMRMSDFLQAEFAKGLIQPFWKEGLHGIVYDRLFSSEKVWPIGIKFTEYEYEYGLFEVGDWNVSIGYVGWFFIAPFLVPFYLLYTMLLGVVSFLLIKKIGMTELSKDVLWYAWLVYMLAPWPAAFVGFIYSLLVFLAIKRVLLIMPMVRFFPRWPP